jgi:putative ABC transport system substrate-binding protein
MRRREFTAGLLLAAATRAAGAQPPARQHRIAIIAAGAVARIHDPTVPVFRAFFDELRRLGDVEGQNLTVDGYSGGGRPEGYAQLAREVIARNPEVIVASGNAITGAVRAATGTIPIISISGDPIRSGFATSLAHPGGNITGVTVDVGVEIWGKRLQLLKEAVPSASKVGFLELRTPYMQERLQALQQISARLEISLVGMLVEEATPVRMSARVRRGRAGASGRDHGGRHR